ncbi:MAG: GDSL-type esterase/lipase family protein [Oscillospiraceae bacterium]|nr:GDSL-type esterase/lipase family protein [Oscillospiraceae bacterium]
MKKIIAAIVCAALATNSVIYYPTSASAAEPAGQTEKTAVSDSVSMTSVTGPYKYVSGAANPVISRNVPAYSGTSYNPSAGNDDFYYSLWNASPEDYLAYDLSAVPAQQKKTVIAVWYNLSSYDSIGQYISCNAEPIDYTIEVNSAAGGSYPETGWEIAETIENNGYSSRQHVINMEGYNWIRVNVTKAAGNTINLNFDIHDVSEGISDSWIFFGDSITAGGVNNAYGTGFATFINKLDPRYFPVQENGGIGGITSTDGKQNIDKWLSTSPAKYVSIAYGTNDAWGNPGNTQKYYDNTKYMIDAVLQSGKTPVLPKIPSSTNPDVGPNIGYYNAMIDKLYSEYGDKLVKGPDFESFFNDNPEYLSSDGVHPNSEGYEAMRSFWAETMYKNVYSSAADTVKHDVNMDNAFNVEDIVLVERYMLNVPDTTLSDWEAANFNENDKLDVYDLCMMKNALLKSFES